MKKILTSNGKPLFKDGKLLASSRGSGSATVTTKAGWQGTPIPADGKFDNMYLNINTTPEELVSKLDEIIAQLGADTTETVSLPLLANEADTLYMGLGVTPEGIYALTAFLDGYDTEHFIYSKDAAVREQLETRYGFVGWKPGLSNTNGTIIINGTNNAMVNMQEYLGSFYPMWEAAVNEISSFVSSTSFEVIPSETITLTGDYNGSPVTIELGSGIKPSTVPNTGYVDKVYFNISLNTEEVVEILNTLEDSIYWYDIGFENDLQYWFAATSNKGIILLKQKSTGNYQIGNPATLEVYFNYGYTDVDFTGWNPQFKGSVSILEDAIGGNPSRGSNPGDENYRLTSLISSTPYSKPKFIDLKSFIKEQKLPLNIKVNIPNAIEMVNELPTSNVQKDVIYKVDKITTSEVYLSMPSLGSVSKLNDTWQVTDVDVLPDNMLVTGENGGYVYVCGDYAYIKMINEDTGEEQVLTIGEMYTAMGVKLPDKGVVKTIEEMTEDGVYIIKGGQITLQGVKGETYNYIDNQWYNFKEIFEGINDGSISNIDNINFGMKVREYLFVNCNNLKEINSEKITRIGVRAFSDCDNLTTVNLPKCVEIDAGAFYSCQSLSNVTIPNCKRIWGGTFQYCQELKTINLPLITEFGDVDAYGSDCTFEGSGLTEIYLPSCHTLRYRTFASCQSLVSVKLPVCINLGEETFDHCYALTDLYLGKRTTVYDSTFKDLVEPVKIHVRSSMIGDYQNDSDWKTLVDAGKVILVGDYTD